ncbi:MAG: DNA alkylation repair protein [Candidatus Staskawiczbacteria bacterium]|jgi:3-methyladenine DNA glycosylase AlkD
MKYEEILQELRFLKNPKNVEGMARFGIRPKTKVYGVSVPKLRKMAKIIKKDHNLALELWDSGIHEARLLAGFVADAEKLTNAQMEKWTRSFDSWDIVDQVCGNLFDKTEFVYKKVFEFSKRKKEFEKRTAFTLMATLSVHNKKMKDQDFIKFFPLIEKASNDERNFVKKAVNWALRQIGKRNVSLNKEAIILAKKIQTLNYKSSKWIANNAIKELTSSNVQQRIKSK